MQENTWTGPGGGSNAGSQGLGDITSDTQIPGSGHGLCGRTLIQEEKRVMKDLALDIPNLTRPDFQWTIGKTALVLNSETMAAEWASRGSSVA